MFCYVLRFTTRLPWMVSLQHCTAGCQLLVLTACQQMILQQTDMVCRQTEHQTATTAAIHWRMFDKDGELVNTEWWM